MRSALCIRSTRCCMYLVVFASLYRVSYSLSLNANRSAQRPYSLGLGNGIFPRNNVRKISRIQQASIDDPLQPSEIPVVKKKKGDKVKYYWAKPAIAIALPALLGMLSDPLLSLMDTAYVGRLGTLELAALGACTSVFHLAFNAFRATTAATTTLVAAQLPHDPEAAQQVTIKSIQLGIGIGVVVALLLAGFGPQILSRMGVPITSPLYKPAADYLYTRCWAAPVVLFLGVSEGAFRGHGNTMLPLVASLVAAVANAVLDPALMFAPLHWGVRGAAAATAASQVFAGIVFFTYLRKNKMIPSFTRTKPSLLAAKKKTKGVIRTIIQANLALWAKQGSLLLAWAAATARATRLGAVHVASHQVALSVWLVFALILDGLAVSAQVLVSRAFAQKDIDQAESLQKFMLGGALVQGVVSYFVVSALDSVVPKVFTSDPLIQQHLHMLMPHLAFQQLLVSMTLVWESLAIGANQFTSLAVGTIIATVASFYQLSKQTTVEGIWSRGIVTLFAGRLLTAIISYARAQRRLRKQSLAE